MVNGRLWSFTGPPCVHKDVSYQLNHTKNFAHARRTYPMFSSQRCRHWFLKLGIYVRIERAQIDEWICCKWIGCDWFWIGSQRCEMRWAYKEGKECGAQWVWSGCEVEWTSSGWEAGSTWVEQVWVWMGVKLEILRLRIFPPISCALQAST